MASLQAAVFASCQAEHLTAAHSLTNDVPCNQDEKGLAPWNFAIVGVSALEMKVQVDYQT